MQRHDSAIVNFSCANSLRFFCWKQTDYICFSLHFKELKKASEVKQEMTSKLQKRDIEKLEIQQQQELKVLVKKLKIEQVKHLLYCSVAKWTLVLRPFIYALYF